MKIKFQITGLLVLLKHDRTKNLFVETHSEEHSFSESSSEVLKVGEGRQVTKVFSSFVTDASTLVGLSINCFFSLVSFTPTEGTSLFYKTEINLI